MNIVTMAVGTVPETETTAPFVFEDGDKGGSITYDKSDGWLYIDLRKHFNVALRVGDWARHLQIFKWDPNIGEWVAENRDPGLPFMVYMGKGDDPVQAYLQTIPPEILKAVAPFKWRRSAGGRAALRSSAPSGLPTAREEKDNHTTKEDAYE